MRPHEGIHLQFEGFIYAAARDALATQLASGAGPDIVGPVGIGGAEAFHGQWLDLQPYIEASDFDMSQFPQATVDLYNAGGEGQVGIPYAIYPSVLFYKADMFREAGLAEPPTTWNSDYTMPDGSTRKWDYDTIREIAKILTVDENGVDATPGRFRSGQDRPVGLRAAARRPAPDRCLLRGRRLHGRRWQDRPDPRGLGRRLETLL